MPIVDIGLPLHEPIQSDVRFAYLSRTDANSPGHCGSLLYLRTMRTGGMGRGAYRALDRNFKEWEYLRKARYYANCLVEELGEGSFHAIVSPPSRYPHALPYKTAFLKTGKIAWDFSDLFRRERDVYAGRGAAFREYCDAISCRGGS